MDNKCITEEVLEMLGRLSEEKRKEVLLMFQGVIAGLLMAAGIK